MTLDRMLIDFGASFLKGGTGFWGWILSHWPLVTVFILVLGIVLDWTVWVLRFPRGRRARALLRRLTGREAHAYRRTSKRPAGRKPAPVPSPPPQPLPPPRPLWDSAESLPPPSVSERMEREVPEPQTFVPAEPRTQAAEPRTRSGERVITGKGRKGMRIVPVRLPKGSLSALRAKNTKSYGGTA